MRKTKGQTTNKGITIISLIITIILMLILATVTVNVVMDGGLFEYAGNAKSVTELASEKETVQKAGMIAKNISKTGKVTVGEFEKTIKKMVDDVSNITVMANSETIALKFNNSNRYYEIDSKGKVTGPIELGIDENAGDLSKGGKYDGKTEDTAFEITCIEDLVEFSKNYTTYQNSCVKLTKDLDFNSIFSYNDYTSIAYGNLNGDDKTEDLKTELTKQGDDCIGFTPIEVFKGTFDGQGKKICNLYQNTIDRGAGLFHRNYGMIKNLGLKNINIEDKYDDTKYGSGTGGVVSVSYAGSKIENCFVEGKIIIKTTAARNIGLIVGSFNEEEGTIGIENCCSKGELTIDTPDTSSVGGICGRSSKASIKRCYNIMEIDCDATDVGGILGANHAGSGIEAVIEECYHIGNITVENGKKAGGIAGGANCTLKNCYNIGNVIGNTAAAGISAGYWNYADFFNCYSVGQITSSSSGRCGIITNGNQGRTYCSLFWEKRR